MAIKKKKAVKVVAKAKTAKVKKVSRPVVAKATAKKTTAKSKVVKTTKAVAKVKSKVVSKKTAVKVKKTAIPVKTKSTASKAKKVVAKKVTKKATSSASATKAKKPIAKKITPKTAEPSKPAITKKAENPVKAVVTESTAKQGSVTSTEKVVKIGVKTKKQLVAVAPQPVIEVSDYPKNKVKTLLISQPKPETDKNPYYDLANKYNLIETFRQFIKIEGLPVKDFRAQRIDILEHKAVILTSRMAVDHYFRMCNEMRVTVPESMKYFCINEATAYYLQKYIQYRKRKIFFGHQTIQDLVDVIRKNREEKFLLPAADVQKEQIVDFLDALNIKYTKAIMYRTVSADLTDIKNLNEYDVLVFFTPAGIRSLKHNFPTFVQGNTRIACFGAATANTLLKNGYRLDVYAPNPKNPSMSGALDSYIKEANKR
ncbi:MAG: uroporphyrinogen-III synthase [Bacteroidota bacterium]